MKKLDIMVWRPYTNEILRIFGVLLTYVLITIPLIMKGNFLGFRHSILTLSDKYYPAFYWKDPSWYIWSYSWWPHAIGRGENPFLTNYLWYPFRTDLALATSIPTLAILMAPVTLILGPVFSYNMVQMLTPALNGLAAYLLIKEIVHKHPAAVLGGLVFGFSPYVFAQIAVHPHLSFVALLPLGCLLYLRWRRAAVSNKTFIILGAILITLEAGISLEVLAFCGFSAVIALLIDYKKLDSRAVVTLVKLVVVSLVLLSPILYFFFVVGKQAITIPSFGNSGMDVLYTIIPFPYLFFHINADFRKYDVPELTLYLGPCLLALFVVGWRRIDKKIYLFLFIFAMASLSTPVILAGSETGIVNPIGFVRYLPLLNHAVLARLSVMFWLALAVYISEAVVHVKPLIATLIAGALLSLAPNPKWLSWYGLSTNFSENYLPPVPEPFFDPKFQHSLDGKAFIVLPYNGLGGIWQAVSGMNFRAMGIYSTLEYSGVIKTPESERLFLPLSPLIAPLANQGPATIDEKWAGDLATFCRENKMDGILMDQDPWAPTRIIPALVSAGWLATYNGHIVILTPAP